MTDFFPKKWPPSRMVFSIPKQHFQRLTQNDENEIIFPDNFERTFLDKRFWIREGMALVETNRCTYIVRNLFFHNPKRLIKIAIPPYFKLSSTVSSPIFGKIKRNTHTNHKWWSIDCTQVTAVTITQHQKEFPLAARISETSVFGISNFLL